MRLRGWRPGLKKVRLTRTLRDGGTPLSTATRLTGKLLDGDEVSVHLAQFETVEEARAALLALGVEVVRA